MDLFDKHQLYATLNSQIYPLNNSSKILIPLRGCVIQNPMEELIIFKYCTECCYKN